MSTWNALGRLRNNNSKQGRCFEGSFLTMFFANTPYSEVRESLKDQTLDDKQTFLKSMIHYFLNLDQADQNRLHEIEGAIDSILEQE